MYKDALENVKRHRKQLISSATIVIPADPSIVVDLNPKPVRGFMKPARNFWIRRHDFIRILLNAVMKEKNNYLN